jgi:hypothetical protein
MSRVMGWAERDYAKWTDEERERFYGTRSVRAGSAKPERVFRRGVGPAILASGVLFALGRFPASHPILPFLHFRLPASHGSASPFRPTGKISTPGTANIGSTLTFHGTAPPGDGPVNVEGSYDGGQTWETLTRATSTNGGYTAQIKLSEPGRLQIRIVFSDGSKSVGSLLVK